MGNITEVRAAREDDLYWPAVTSYLLELRVRARGDEACAVVDRCLVLVARLSEAGPEDLPVLEAEIERLRGDLERRYGPPRPRAVN
jgi:hypothetical protein